jgi:hypothetical protein
VENRDRLTSLHRKVFSPMFHQVSGMGGHGCKETHRGDVWKKTPNFRDFREMGDGGTSHI